MSKWIKIRVKDFYKDAVGELEYTYVTREVYEALVDTFRKEAHAQEMRDIRHTTKDGYTEGETEDLVELTGESVEDTVIRQMEIETLQKPLTPVEIADKIEAEKESISEVIQYLLEEGEWKMQDGMIHISK